MQQQRRHVDVDVVDRRRLSAYERKLHRRRRSIVHRLRFLVLFRYLICSRYVR